MNQLYFLLKNQMYTCFEARDLSTHLEIKVAEPVVKIGGDESLNFFKLVQLWAELPSDQWSFESKG